MSDVNDDLMLLYVAGVCDADEADRAEALLSAAGPVAAAMMAEAICVFHALPFGLSPVEPPAHCRHSLLGRVTADVSVGEPVPLFGAPVAAFTSPKSPAPSPMSIGPASAGLASRLRWPLYVSSGLAACLAVALTMSVLNGRKMADQLAAMSERDANMSTTLANARDVMASPKVTLASLNTQEAVSPAVPSPNFTSPPVSAVPPAVSSVASSAGKPFGRVLFCPINRRYQFAFANLQPLPDDRKYELWLIADNRPPVPVSLFSVGDDGKAWVLAQVGQSSETFRKVAITDEPATGSTRPTGTVHLAGALPVQ